MLVFLDEAFGSANRLAIHCTGPVKSGRVHVPTYCKAALTVPTWYAPIILPRITVPYSNFNPSYYNGLLLIRTFTALP